jgi:ADP-ribose pyrophosphatase YjhB (NUDIX family)
MHTVSAVYIAHARGEPHAADDARHLAVFTPQQIDVPLAFDHQTILNDYLHYKKTGDLPRPRI